MFSTATAITRYMAVFCLVLATPFANAQANPGATHASQYSLSKASMSIARPALSGYDPVAYFELGRPQRGSGYHTATYKGATYLFSSEDHQRKFESNPERYAPQFGGYCAYGVAVGKKFHSDPNRWKIVAGKLYLNLDQGIQDKWSEDIPGYINKANRNWKDIQFKHPREL